MDYIRYRISFFTDINECLASPCYKTNSVCTNFIGGYNCSCTNGFILGANNVCKGW